MECTVYDVKQKVSISWAANQICDFVLSITSKSHDAAKMMLPIKRQNLDKLPVAHLALMMASQMQRFIIRRFHSLIWYILSLLDGIIVRVNTEFCSTT